MYERGEWYIQVNDNWLTWLGALLRICKSKYTHILIYIYTDGARDMVVFKNLDIFLSVSFMKDSLRDENSHQRVCSLGNGFAKWNGIHHLFSSISPWASCHHFAHIILMFRSSIASQAVFWMTFRVEVAKPKYRYSHVAQQSWTNTKFEFYPPRLGHSQGLKRLHLRIQQRPDISQSWMDLRKQIFRVQIKQEAKETSG